MAQILKLDDFGNEDQGQKRLLMSDLEALEEYRIYKATIHLVTLESRGAFWATQFIVLILAFACVYASVFITAVYPETPAVGEDSVMLIEDL